MRREAQMSVLIGPSMPDFTEFGGAIVVRAKRMPNAVTTPTASVVLAALALGFISGAACITYRDRLILRSLLTQLNNAIPITRRPLGIGTPIRRLARSIEEAQVVLGELSHRAQRRHPVTGLQTREFLLGRIEHSGGGILGVVEMSDFDALYAREAMSAEAALKEFAGRAVRMTDAGRPLAQIDRARFGIWLEARGDNDPKTELEALWYALGDRINASGMDLVPKIRMGSASRIGTDEDGSALLARAIANLSDVPNADDSARENDDALVTHNRMSLEFDLRQAVARHQFTLHYQPFVDAECGTVCGAEALIRWNHPERGLISPGTFVPLVEKSGLAEEVGLWVLDSAIADAARWKHSMLSHVKVAVNLSAHQLTRPDLDTVIYRMLTRHQLPSSLLELELTETVAAIDSETAAALFDRLRKRKISISIDDFGAGYSSLSYLKRLKFDKLKIDREFVTDVDTDHQSQAICQSIIALGRGLGITVLAEGVERAAEYLWLRRHGCRFFQGYYFSQPVEWNAFVSFAQDRAGLAEKIDFSAIGLQNKIGSLAG